MPQSEDLSRPYAGKIEARIGGTRESIDNKLRLDIGASIELLSIRRKIFLQEDNPISIPLPTYSALTIGTDFFTWTRLRAEDNFKFPVEAVDYYFGITATSPVGWLLDLDLPIDMRMRAAHISAHLVDGDTGFTDPHQHYMTYSREFVDVMLSLREENKDPHFIFPPTHQVGIYLGTLWLFHTIPDTLGTITPYAGFDLSWQLTRSFPMTLKAGYEARLNTELEPIGEHSIRAGVKLGTPYSRGVVLEGSYYTGRSQYGQHFHRREEYFSVGFAIDY